MRRMTHSLFCLRKLVGDGFPVNIEITNDIMNMFEI